MACFLVPMGEAVVVTAAKKVVAKREKRARNETADETTDNTAGRWSQRLSWLNTMLWGGSLLLALEHIWHGEVVPWPPFLTVMETPGEVGPMLHELATYGIAMAAVVTIVWAVMVAIAEVKAKTTPKEKAVVVGGA